MICRSGSGSGPRASIEAGGSGRGASGLLEEGFVVRAAILKAACEGKLVPTEAELARKEGRGYEPAGVLLGHILKKRRARWEEGMFAPRASSSRRTRTMSRWVLRRPLAADREAERLMRLSHLSLSSYRGFHELELP